MARSPATASSGGAASGMGAADGSERPITPVAMWTDALAQRRPPRFDPTAHRRVVMLAAHPDDETLGAGGCLQVLRRSAAVVTLVVATDGEAAYPFLDAGAWCDLGRARRAELTAALAAQGLAEVSVRWLGLPDSGLAEHADALRDALVPLLADADAYLAPCPRTRIRITAPPVGLPRRPPRPPRTAGRTRSGCGPGTPRTAHPRCWPPRYSRTQTGRSSCSSASLGPALIERFTELYADGNDPWRAGSWYERRKRAVALASLPRQRYRAAFEPGCGTGELTIGLAERCGCVLASDPVPTAVERARAATAGMAGIRVEHDSLPAAVPHQPIDLAVFSEVLYYLDDATVHETLDRTLAVLQPGGDVLVVHWRGWPAEAPRDAVATHAMLRDRSELQPLVEHVDEPSSGCPPRRPPR